MPKPKTAPAASPPPRTTLRFADQAMYERIRKLAEQESRSIHGQIIALLRDALSRARLKGEK